MIKPFNYWKKLYDDNKLEEFNDDSLALLWLKIKSIIRKDLLRDFLAETKIELSEKTLSKQFVELYELLAQNVELSHRQIDSFIREKSIEQEKVLDSEKLVSELYKFRYFDWGGDYKNALDKYLINSYVKVYRNFDELTAKFDTEINRAVQGYVLCSWYNHWSSILIEHIFKNHPLVLPTVGQIKKVDFFVADIPFDLKVTYLPINYIATKRKESGLKPELTELKQKSRQVGIKFTNHKKADDTYYEIVEKMKDRDDDFCRKTLQDIKDFRLSVLEEVRNNPKLLVKNLYEQQGEMRFDAANRLYLVLVDTEDFDNSWKLKRNLDLLKPKIWNYLDNFQHETIEDLKIDFEYHGKSYTALSDILFIVK